MDRQKIDLYFSFIGDRLAGKPLQYITGRQEFMSLDFAVTPDVLIPRQETETLVETVIDCLRQVREGDGSSASQQEDSSSASQNPDTGIGQWNNTSAVQILDIGTGSGCIAVSLAYYIRNCHVTAIDISEKALEVAYGNAVRNGVAGKISFVQYDIMQQMQQKNCPNVKHDIMQQIRQKNRPHVSHVSLADAVVSNPPYIPTRDIENLPVEVKKYEPIIALDGGSDGLDFYRIIIGALPYCLKPGGLMAFEVGYGQAGTVSALMSALLSDIKVVRDLSGIERVIVGRYPI